MVQTTDEDLAAFVRVVTKFTGMGGEDDDVDALAHAWAVAQTPEPPSREASESDYDF